MKQQPIPPARRRRPRRRHERGFALAIAIILAVLYFGLIELMMIESSRELDQARRLRARIVAQTLAENAAERAALQMVSGPAFAQPITETDWQGTFRGRLQKKNETFLLEGEGETSGVVKSKASVRVQGRIVNGNEIYIDYTIHEP